MRHRLTAFLVLVALLPFLTGATIVIRGPRVPAAATPTEFVTGYTGGGDPGASGELGYRFTVGGSAITITHLGVIRTSGMYGDVTVKLYDSDGTTVLRSAVVDYDSVSVGAKASASITSLSVSAGAVRTIRGVVAGYNGPRFLSSTSQLDGATAAATINSLSDESGDAATGGAVGFTYTIP